MKSLKIDMNVMILGSEWKVYAKTESEEPRLKDKNGFTDWTEKAICIESEPIGDIYSIETYMNQVIRHEVVHAFLYESGLGDCFTHTEYGHEETIVDWFAYQLPNIQSVIDDIISGSHWEYDDK